jgi:L-ribulose-5-phosphate 4-epimerase
MLEQLKRAVYEANLQLQRSGLVILTWGNVSGFDAESQLMVIKPSGVSYEQLRPEQMVVVNLRGEVVEGELRPSSDTPTHLVLYQAFAGLGGIAHTHSPYATAWAQARRPLPCYGTTHADTFGGPIPVTEDLPPEAIAGHYELETGRAIVRAFANLDPLRIPAVLVASHGPFTWGRSPGEAVHHSLVLEQVAFMALLSETLAPGLGTISPELLERHYGRKHGHQAYYGQP